MYKDTSTNGTVINNMMVHGKTVPINHGDTILIAGKYQITWEKIDSLLAPSKMAYQPTRLLRLNTVTTCRKCGTQLDDRAKFCPNCGNIISGSYNRQETNRKRILLGIVIGLGICAIVGCFYGVKEYAAYDLKKRQAEAMEAVRQDSIQYAKEEMARKDAERLNTITDNSNNSYSKYVGRWRLRKTTDEGQKMFIEVTLKENYSGEVAGFHDRGNVADVLFYEEYPQCILVDGVLYMTKDGDINGRGVSKLRLGSDGLYSYEYDKFVREDDSSKQIESNEGNKYSDDVYSSSSSLVFLDAQYVIGYLLNQRFTNSTGIDIWFDGDGVIYVDGDAAGVISVLRYNATSALLRYGGGMYSEGEIGVRIENNRLVLIDPIDGTVWYQK